MRIKFHCQWIEQTSEFTLMWRQHNWPACSLANGVRQGGRLFRKTRQSVGIEDHGRLACQRRIHLFAHGRAHPATWAQDHRISALVREEFRKLSRSIDGADHNCQALDGIDGQRISRASDRDKPRARAKCPARR